MIAGQVVPVTVRATIEPGWQIYSLTQKSGGPTPLEISVSPTPPFDLAAAATGPAPRVKRDATFGIETETYAATPVFVVPVRVSDSATPGPAVLKLKVRSQACSDNVCLEAVTTNVDVPVSITRK